MMKEKDVLATYDEQISIAGIYFTLYARPDNKWEIKFLHERGFIGTIATSFNSKKDAIKYLESYYDKKVKHIKYL